MMGMPVLDRWMWQVLGGLLGAYVVELVLLAAGVDVGALAWRPIGAGAAPWQPLTRFAVQGIDVLSVLLSLLLLYFLLPAIGRTLGRRALAEAVGAAAIGATLLPGAVDLLHAAGLMHTGWVALHGWGALGIALVVLFGLGNPETVVQVFLLFVPIPVPTIAFVWGPLVVPVLQLLVAVATGADTGGPLQLIGIWLGAYAWWHLRGPGGRRRALKRKARSLERKLERLQVLPGGKGGGRYDTH